MVPAAPALPILPPNNAPASPREKEKQKRNRTSKPKVKTGCNNCKQRRIKCDETRPGCTQCLKARKNCPGYPAPSRSSRPHEVVVIAPKPVLAIAPSPNGHGSSLPAVRPRISPPTQVVSRRRAAKLTVRRGNEDRASQPPTVAAGEIEEIPRGDALSLYQPGSDLALRGQEGLYFQLFRTHTARELSGFFDSVFWTQTVLRECHYEDSIRHAVIALGALYKTLEQSSASPPGSPTATPDPASSPVHHWQVAVRQYSEAIKSVVALGPQNQRSHRVLLMATVLLACFDSFVGDHRQAIYQIQNGLRLMDRVRAERQPAGLLSGSPRPEPVEDELVQMFTRLAIQAKSYDMAFHFPQPYVIRLTPETQPVYQQQPTSPPSPTTESGTPPPPPPPPQSPSPFPFLARPSIPAQFSTLLEARLAWDVLCETMMRFTEVLFAQTTRGVDGAPMGILPRELKQHGAGFKGELESWSAAFRPILEGRHGPGVSAQEKAGIAVLRMTQIMGEILFLMTFHDSEAGFDVFEGRFRAIVDLATEVVGDEERREAARRCPDPALCAHRAPASAGGGFFVRGVGYGYGAVHVKPSFSADLGIVPPLYVVATKCRNYAVRRRAIELLRSSSRREGMWDSQLSGIIGEWVASIEEEGDADSWPPPPHIPRPSGENGHGAAEDLGPGGDGAGERWVPGDRRVMVRSVDFDLRARSARLSVGTRGIMGHALDPRARETSITW
ncbi:uncharacterized protein DNG_01958 [Cephalotrichum gorgonifer]|uniref:Zn(2)-C6 fungal-type domain-containing protein n=1 Tax=Cephalotrichum gorgonifer TaxID=2041049 RepID=A0AAE8MUC8_9PEZI|nr:uncharacterized protein DNG_01958 [Cephalotrichum gorgonifer]